MEGWYGRLRVKQPRQRGCFIFGLTAAEPVLFYGTEGGSPSKGLGDFTRYKRLLRQFFSLAFILIFSGSLSASEVKFRLNIDTLRAFLGDIAKVGINSCVDAIDSSLANGQSIGGFSFLISYDNANLGFLGAQKGQLLLQQGWEFFTYRLVTSSPCSTGCVANLIKLTAYADINNGVPNTTWSRQNKGQLAVLKFRIQNDLILGCQALPVSWFWQSCSDNVIFDSTGGTQWVVDSLYAAYGAPANLSTVFPADISNCDTLSGTNAKRFVVFNNGAIAIPCDGENEVGDLNINGFKYEIGDYVFFENYFIYGDVVLSNNPSIRNTQRANSDINQDGQFLQISDLVLMLQIILGEISPLPKVTPPSETVDLSWVVIGNKFKITTNSPARLGGLFLRFGYGGKEATIIEPAQANGMKQRVNIQDGELRILLNPEGTDGNLPPGQNTLTLSIDGTFELIEAQASSVDGRSLSISSRSTAIPTGFSLSQNFPNPFNPSTSFTLSLPKTSHYAVKIYNLTGQLVRSFEGEAGAGNRTFVWDGTDENGVPVSSGIYFYKAQAGEFSQTKKMLLLR